MKSFSLDDLDLAVYQDVQTALRWLVTHLGWERDDVRHIGWTRIEPRVWTLSEPFPVQFSPPGVNSFQNAVEVPALDVLDVRDISAVSDLQALRLVCEHVALLPTGSLMPRLRSLDEPDIEWPL